MIDAGVITVDLLLAPESRPGDLRVRRASLLNERTLNLMDRLARSSGSCREVVPLVFSLCQSNGLFTLGAKGKLLEPGVAKMFSTVFFSLAFVCIGLDTRLKDIVSKENRNVLRSFLVAQTFNIVVTFVIACLLFGLLKPAL